jgi:predicted MPP superfamily phosphohydrolase
METGDPILKAWPILGILIVQTLLCLAHWFLYSTLVDFWWPLTAEAVLGLRIALIGLSCVFVVAALLSFRFFNPMVALLYRIASVWLGLLNFLFWSACLAWIADLALRFALPRATHLEVRPYLISSLFALAIVATLYGLLNARVIRLRTLAINLEKLPDSWRGRKALVASDLHLGHINGVRFAKRIAEIARQLRPDVIFIPGDLFDGTKATDRIAAPLYELSPPLGVYFVTGNHEMFGGAKQYCEALSRAGFHVLEDQRVVVDNLHIVGVAYNSSTHPIHLRHFLMGLGLKDGVPSILLQHVPNRLPIVEQAGVGLLVSGHTHGGQFFPFTWITRRAFGEFTHGLHRFGGLQVYTSTGAGTWGPPMRVGTHSEMVLLTFE